MNYLSKLACNITPYTAGEQPQDKSYIKLNTNENPYPPSPKVKEALSEYDCGKLRLYSDPDNKLLKSAISARYGVAQANVFVGNGSDEVLAFCFPAFFDPDGKGAAFADVTYSFYPVFCDLFGIKKVIVPLLHDFTLDVNAFCGIDAQGLVIANPNAPTGIVLSRNRIEETVKDNPDKIVIIDEAYSAFSEESVVGLTAKYNNLLVVKTFSKAYGLAGIRCGYAIGNPALIDGLNRIKNSFNSYTVNSLTERIAAAAIADTDYYQKVTQDITAARSFLTEGLIKLGFKVLPSGANFVFAKKAGAKDLYLRLKQNGVLVRYFDKPRISEYLRITVGTYEEIKKMLDTLSCILES